MLEKRLMTNPVPGGLRKNKANFPPSGQKEARTRKVAQAHIAESKLRKEANLEGLRQPRSPVVPNKADFTPGRWHRLPGVTPCLFPSSVVGPILGGHRQSKNRNGKG